jgi:hypothetical protein
MSAALLKALMLTALLTAVAPVCLADPPAEPFQAREAAAAERAEEGSAVQALSTLGALGLGILGLLWVRRHTAEL